MTRTVAAGGCRQVTKAPAALGTQSRLLHNLWAPADCPLCKSGMPVELVGS